MNDLEVIECIAGDTTDILELAIQTNKLRTYPLELAALDSNYTCKITVEGAPVAINRNVPDKTADSKYFRGWLTPAETTSLPPADYILAMQISNATLTPNLVKTKRWTLRIIADPLP